MEVIHYPACEAKNGTTHKIESRASLEPIDLPLVERVSQRYLLSVIISVRLPKVECD